MNTYTSTDIKTVELLCSDLKFFDDDMDFLNPEYTRSAHSSQHNLMPNNKMECSSQEGTSGTFDSQTLPSSTHERLSQSSNMEYSTQESMASTDNMDISSQESSISDKMCISSQETSVDTQIISPELEEMGRKEFAVFEASNLHSKMPQADQSSGYKTNNFPQIPPTNTRNTRNLSVVNDSEETFRESKNNFVSREAESRCHKMFRHKIKNLLDEGKFYHTDISRKEIESQTMSVSKLNSTKKSRIVQICRNVSGFRKTDSLAEPDLSSGKKYLKMTISENTDNLFIPNKHRAHEVCYVSEGAKVQSSSNFDNQDKVTNCEAMITSSQESSQSQIMDISSQETVNINEETIFKINKSEGKAMLQNAKASVDEPVWAKGLCCCNKDDQIHRSILSIRKRHRALLKRKNALKNHEARIAEREAAILRREEQLKVREQKVLNYESAIFHSEK